MGTDNKIFRDIQVQINGLYQAFDMLIANTLQSEAMNYEKAIEHTLALIPKLLFEIYHALCPEFCEDPTLDTRSLFCICINYNSTLFPNNRFHLHLDDGRNPVELKTFCYKNSVDDPVKKLCKAYQTKNVDKKDRILAQYSFNFFSPLFYLDRWYDVDSPFVKLLDLFYDTLGTTENEFSMNKFFSEELDNNNNFLMDKTLLKSGESMGKTGYRGWYFVLDEDNYFPETGQNDAKKRENQATDIIDYLKEETYGADDTHSYINYASFLAEAARCSSEQILALDTEHSFPMYQQWTENPNREAYHKLFENQLEGTPLRFRQYNIPIFGFQADHSLSTPPRRVIGNLMIPSLIDIDEAILSVFYEKVDSFLNKISQYEKIILANKNAVRASIAQVMARNMSHNFGSHVLSNLIGDNIYEKLRDEYIKCALNKFSSHCTDEVFKNGKDLQLSYFFQYLKSRMDYLSEVTFGVPNLLTTKMMCGDVMKDLDQVRILLNFISGVSDFNYEFKLRFNDRELCEQNDIGVAFPSDVLGCQAFCNIIENIIRNTAKHTRNNNSKTVTFTITIKDNFAEEEVFKDVEGVNELYCVEIDNGVEEDDIDKIVNGVTIADPNTRKVKIIEKGQNTRLNESVLQGQNLRSHSLGLLEMEASAAFLRQIDLPEIESDNYTLDYDDSYFHIDEKGKKHLNILKAFAIKESAGSKRGRLGYRFFLQKPKEFLLVGDWKMCERKENEDEETWKQRELAIKKQQLNCGFQIITVDEFCQAMKDGKAFAHRFLIYQSDISPKAKNYLKPTSDCKTLLPLRILEVKAEDMDFLYQQGNDVMHVSQLLRHWSWSGWCKEDAKIRTGVERSNKGKIECNQVVFLNHGTKGQHSNDWNGYEDEDPNDYSIINNEGAKCCSEFEVWIESLTSRTWGKLPSFGKLSQGENNAPECLVSNYTKAVESNEQIRKEIFEAYHNKVIVIDERVQKYALENSEGKENASADGGKIPCIELFESTNVYVPTGFSLDPTDFGNSKEKVEQFLNDDAIRDAFVLIHYGVLERMYRGNPKTITKKLVEWAGKAKRVVVTSGRGAHSLDLPNSVCFVNLSSVLYAFCENRNKYIINDLINQARRKRNE